MTNFPPPPGTALEDVDTPCLVIDLPAMEHNIETLHHFFRTRPARVRSVTKGHKCPAIAQRQMTADGAVPYGLCCAKVSEAEVMVDAGARHVRLIEQVVDKTKIERLMGLARNAHVIALVDDPRHVSDLADATASLGLTLDVLVEVEIGLERTGVLAGREAVELARSIEGCRSLRFAGLSGHEGTIAVADPAGRPGRAQANGRAMLPSEAPRRSARSLPVAASSMSCPPSSSTTP